MRIIAVFATMVGMVVASGAALAADLSGKTVQFVIPFSESGGSAKWANFYAPLLSDALPGNPTVIVKFMPGAGSTKGANYFSKAEERRWHIDLRVFRLDAVPLPAG